VRVSLSGEEHACCPSRYRSCPAGTRLSHCPASGPAHAIHACLLRVALLCWQRECPAVSPSGGLLCCNVCVACHTVLAAAPAHPLVAHGIHEWVVLLLCFAQRLLGCVRAGAPVQCGVCVPDWQPVSAAHGWRPRMFAACTQHSTRGWMALCWSL
jgi:hypothetical protein